MLLLIALVASLLLFIILYLVIMAIQPKNKAVTSRIQNLNRAGHGEDLTEYWKEQKLSKSFKERVFKPLGHWLSEEAKKITPKQIYAEAEVLVDQSGGFNGWGVKGFFTCCAVMGILAYFMAVFYIWRKHPSGLKTILTVIGFTMCGFLSPFIYIKSAIEERRKQIRLAMPDMMDLLCVSVQAGLGFDGALSKVVAKMKGPLVEEFERMLQELRMGVTRRVALTRLADRCGIEEMKLFVAALIQSERLGVGMGQVLEVQSENMRNMRRQKAKEAANKLPVKILLPTVVFIFPVLFVVVLGPAIVRIIEFVAKI